MSKKVSVKPLILCFVLVIAGLAAVAGMNVPGCSPIEQLFKDEYDQFRSIKPGMSEQEVTEVLGIPFRVYDKAEANGSYYVEGYAYKERPVTNKVFIYVGVEAIAYIYTDAGNKVEDVFVGGS